MRSWLLGILVEEVESCTEVGFEDVVGSAGSLRYGIYSGWDSSGTEISLEECIQKADELLTEASLSPRIFTPCTLSSWVCPLPDGEAPHEPVKLTAVPGESLGAM